MGLGEEWNEGWMGSWICADKEAGTHISVIQHSHGGGLPTRDGHGPPVADTRCHLARRGLVCR